MDAAELINRMKELEHMVSSRVNLDPLYQSGWCNAYKKMISVIKQMEEEQDECSGTDKAD